MARTIRQSVATGLLLLLSSLPPAAQVTRPTAPVNGRGQVYAPNGAPLQMQIRIQLLSDDTSRPPEYLFTDSHGRFSLHGLSPFESYRIVVESDGQNWDTTVESFFVTGPRFVVFVHLKPLVREPVPAGSRVSAKQAQVSVPRSARKKYEEGVKLLAQGDTGAARELFEEALALCPDFIEARNELAVALLREGRLADAEAQLRRALQAQPDAVGPLINLGLCLYRQQRSLEAIPYLERALQLEAIHPQGHLLLGMVLVQAGDDARAEPVLRRAYEQGGARAARAQYYLARIYTRRRDYPRAVSALETYLRDSPGAPDAAELQQSLEKLRQVAAPPTRPPS